MKTPDMSPEAITRRLRHVDELRDLCIALAGPRLKRPWGAPDAPADIPELLRQVREQGPKYAPQAPDSANVIRRMREEDDPDESPDVPRRPSGCEREEDGL